MTPVQFGFCMPVGAHDRAGRATYVRDVNKALELVADHFDAAWLIDHLQDGNIDMLEGFTALTYFSALHPQLKFGHSVLCQSFRNPALLAKMAATLHFLTAGRFILGIGAGWNKEEYKAYGYDFPPGRVRVEQLEEALQIINALWTQDSATFEGKYYGISEAHLEPKPDPMPAIMVGAFGPKMLRLAARYAGWWDVSSTGIVSYRRMVREFERACAEVGRDPATVRRSWSGGCMCAATADEARAIGGDRYTTDDDDFNFVGTPRGLVEQMRAFVAEGVDYFILDCGGFPRLTTLELLVNEVLPALND
jgi:alkanesulfonate monooxygenase SsuD/methylene tetrahydromethanopterin reductase-like flavin-dependent oxidoreductase (luciferase family)